MKRGVESINVTTTVYRYKEVLHLFLSFFSLQRNCFRRCSVYTSFESVRKCVFIFTFRQKLLTSMYTTRKNRECIVHCVHSNYCITIGQLPFSEKLA